MFKKIVILLLVASYGVAMGQSPEVKLLEKSTWPGGYNAEVTITPLQNISSWTVVLNIPTGVVNALWNGKFTESGGKITVTPDTWNSVVAAGSSVSFGFTVSGSSSSATYDSFTWVADGGGSVIVGKRF